MLGSATGLHPGPLLQIYDTVQVSLPLKTLPTPAADQVTCFIFLTAYSPSENSLLINHFFDLPLLEQVFSSGNDLAVLLTAVFPLPHSGRRMVCW